MSVTKLVTGNQVRIRTDRGIEGEMKRCKTGLNLVKMNKT